MTDLDRYFQGIADLAQRLEASAHFDTHLKTFRQLVRDFRTYLYHHSDDPVVHDHLDYLAEFDLSPPQGRFIENFIPKSARDMYGNYQLNGSLMLIFIENEIKNIKTDIGLSALYRDRHRDRPARSALCRLKRAKGHSPVLMM